MKKVGEASGDLNKFMNKVVKYSMVTWQADLSSTRVSPVQDGRLRSNWFASSGSSSNASTDDTNSPQTDANSLELDYKQKYHLTNNLDYAERLCFGNYAVSKPKDWFPAYWNSNGQKVVDAAVRKAEGEA
jgi:hypothetical protein